MRGRGWTGSFGSEPSFKQIVRGWVVWTPSVGNTIRDFWNVSSVTDNGAGDVTTTWQIPFGYTAGSTGYAVMLFARGTGVKLNACLDPSPTLGNVYTNAFVRSRSIAIGGAAGDASVYCVIAYGA